MKKNIIEKMTPEGNVLRMVEEKTGMPAKYVLGAAGAVLLLALITRKSGGKKSASFFGKFITPLIVATLTNKLMNTVKGITAPKHEDNERAGMHEVPSMHAQ